MKGYIDKTALMKTVHTGMNIIEVMQTIINAPAADVRPVVRGRKEKAQQQPYFRGHFPTFICSECHREVNKRWKYCPNCGAEMQGGDE